MASYRALKEQAQALAEKVEQARLEELADVIAGIRELAAEYNLNAEDIFGPQRPRPRARNSKLQNAKYFDPRTGASWSGRGRPPEWIKGKDRSRFLIAK
jgi:DNA-binding protein H-NS